jgi:hypothetical protein
MVLYLMLMLLLLALMLLLLYQRPCLWQYVLMFQCQLRLLQHISY